MQPPLTRMAALIVVCNRKTVDMGVYYYLRNDTKKQEIHLDSHVKLGPITRNEAVHFAFINYMMENQEDTFQILSDMNEDREFYEDVDLLKYQFANTEVIEIIIEKLNKIYGREKYKVVNGIGQNIEE